MSDLIDRQAAIDEMEEYWRSLNLRRKRIPLAAEAVYRDLKGVVATLPSAQPEIIRCKDCKYWDTSWQNDYAPNYHYCPNVDGTRRDDFYCADAERRTDD